MPFVKGKSGNPGGRPKGLAALVREKTRDNAEQVEFMLRVARSLDPKTPAKDRVSEATIKEVLEAHKWLTDRGQGKAVETVVNVEGEANPLEGLTTEELKELAKPVEH